jgi:hypothetical protein
LNTIPTHLVISSALNKKYGHKLGLLRSAFLWGAIAPDIPLILLTIGYMTYIRFFTSQSIMVGMEHVFDNLFFNDPWWILSHNFLHSPTMLLLLGILFWRIREKKQGKWFLSFFFGNMIHSIIDILTHHDDGPLLFFPFEWQTRFYSPISYWDKAHYASQVFWVEVGINILLLCYLFMPKIIQYFKKTS